MKKARDVSEFVILDYHCPDCKRVERQVRKKNGTKFRCKRCGYIFSVPFKLTEKDEFDLNKIKRTRCRKCKTVFKIKIRHLDNSAICYKCGNTFVITEYPPKSTKIKEI